MDIIDFSEKPSTLFDKYAPKTIPQIIGAKRQVYALVDWLKNYEKNAIMNTKDNDDKKKGKKNRKRKKEIIESENEDEKDEEDDEENDESFSDMFTNSDKKKKKDPNTCACAIVTGDHGTGKSVVVKAVLHDLGYQIKAVNYAKVGNIKAVDDFIENLLTCGDVYGNIKNKANTKFAVIVDEIQSVITPTEKSIITGLSKINSEIWGCPVIFIGSNKHKKIMTGIKKDCYHISMYPPEANDMLKLLERIGLGEKMKLENEEVAIEIIRYAQNDYRRLIVIMGELLRIHGQNIITKTDIDNYMEVTSDKDVDKSIYENTALLFSNYQGINSSLKIFGLDKTNMPLMVHQNHFLATNSYIKNRKDIVDLSFDLTNNLAHGDVVENYIYSDQNWTLQETYGFYSCVYPSYRLNQTIDTKKLEHDSKHPYYKPAFSSQYPKDLNRTSTRCINYKKNIKPANEYFTDMTVEDYVLAVKLIRNLLENGRADECEEILKEYNLTTQGIMYVLKMDKINGTRKDVPKSVENKVKHISVEPTKASIIRKI